MAAPRVKLAQLDSGGLAKLQALEDEIGGCVVALEKQARLAQLSKDRLERLQAAEKDLDVVLLAYECD
jgi:hypothetical protein